MATQSDVQALVDTVSALGAELDAAVVAVAAEIDTLKAAGTVDITPATAAVGALQAKVDAVKALAPVA